MADVTRSSRGVATVVGYVLNIGVALLLVTGLLVAASGYVNDQRTRAVHSGLDVVSERLVGNLATADRLAATNGTAHVAVTADLPARVAGQRYTVTLTTHPGENDTTVRLRAPDEGVVVTRTLHTDLPVTNATLHGGALRVVSDGDRIDVEASG